ncbi:hypothetical protein [Domibacillus robiginosus]|uniref:hypothetical protein n=1 Tax=Domibacillus robiginosus TaxID=1071054 RepID=UPI00067C4EE0|nr:hypothetical protein [Domibacillus robiginosus]
MKKWTAIGVILLLSACSAEEELVQNTFPQGTESIIEEPSEEELAEEMKKEAQPAQFNELNSKQPPVNKKVFATGVVTKIVESGLTGSFYLQAADGTYVIMNSTQTDVQENERVTVYGVVGVEKAADGTPIINVVVIEK